MWSGLHTHTVRDVPLRLFASMDPSRISAEKGCVIGEFTAAERVIRGLHPARTDIVTATALTNTATAFVSNR
jgi:hypothetical protein